MSRSLAAFVLFALLTGDASAQPPPAGDSSDVINALLSGLLGLREMTAAELQKEVAEVGGVAFRADVPLDYLTHQELDRYLQELLDAEYPQAKAAADERTLLALDLLPPGTDLRALRARLLQENIAGFYDDRPGKKRLYAVSADRRLTPANQLVLAHELRHALQDQYAQLHDLLPDEVGDFDDRRLALLSLLEGDATLVMEKFLVQHLPGEKQGRFDLSGVSLPAPEIPGAPPVLRDQLVVPYVAGRDFVRALFQKGGWDAVRLAWSHPPESTEQVLHPQKYLEHEAPRIVAIDYVPAGGRLLNEGVLGEALLRTLLGEEAASAAAGWGGDRFRVFDVAGRTLLVWRSLWDTPAAGRAFGEALLGRFRRAHGEGMERDGFTVYQSGEWRFAVGEAEGAVLLVSTNDEAALHAARRALVPVRGARRSP